MQYARILVTPEFMELPTWYELFVDFYNFKVCDDLPAYWGRDPTLYQKPLGKVCSGQLIPDTTLSFFSA